MAFRNHKVKAIDRYRLIVRKRELPMEKMIEEGLARADWPTVSKKVSAFYGEQGNGTHQDHINIAGTAGEEVYAVADGTVMETAFYGAYGNTVILDLGDGIVVKYGHLQEIKVSAGDEIEKGEVIATLGKTGTATGANLSFAVTVDGEKVNPLASE